MTYRDLDLERFRYRVLGLPTDDRPGAALWTTDDYGMVIVIPLTTANLTEWSRAAAIAALGGDVAA